MSILNPNPPKRDPWATTRWSVISRLNERENAGWEASWNWLVETYRSPMERYARRVLTRTTGGAYSGQEAGEVVQDFLATCVEREWLSTADPNMGRFRAYIQTLLKRYCYRHLRYLSAKKRSPGPGREEFSIREDDKADERTAEDLADLEEFDRAWTGIAIERALERLKAENERYYTVIRNLIETDGEGSPDLVERVDTHRSQFPVLKHRALVRFNKVFEEELAQTVGDQEAFEEEWRALAPFVSRHSRRGKRTDGK